MPCFAQPWTRFLFPRLALSFHDRVAREQRAAKDRLEREKAEIQQRVAHLYGQQPAEPQQ